MKKKTCGECRHFREDFKDMCLWKDQHREACADFEPPTNGDRIRQMSNEELVCSFEETCGKFSNREEILAWLNAPAEINTEREEQ